MVGVLLATLFAAVVVRTENPGWEHVVADAVLSPTGGGADDSAVLQRALDEVGERRGGGTVFLKAGTWVLKGPLVIPANTAIKGDYAPDAARRSTLLEVRFGKGDEKGQSPLTLLAGACVQGVWIHYPEQSLEEPIPYPWTIVHGADKQRRNAGCPDHQTVRDVTIANAWKGIRIGPAWNELHTVRNVRMTALAAGFYADSCTDIGRLIDLTVSPEVWAGSGLKGAPDADALERYLKASGAIAVEYGRSDWEYVWGLKVRGYVVGLKYGRGSRGESNSVIADSEFVACGDGLELDELNRVGLAAYDVRFVRCGNPARLTKRFQSVVQFDACDFGGGRILDESNGVGVKIVNPGRGERLRHRPMAMPRPESARLVDASDFGLDAKAEDNAGAIRRALDRCAALGGGTVYVPAGYYAVKSGVTVPSGVELRGSSPAPHHTCSGGSVLLVRYGKGDEDGEPTVRLEPKSGLRGMTVWYPENPRENPQPYPWAVRSLGEDTYLMDVCIANAWRVADFATFPSGGHRISYLSGNGWKDGLKVGNSGRDGWVEETLFNPHYSHRLPGDLPFVAGVPPADWKNRPDLWTPSRWMRKRFDAHAFENCAREHIRGTFVYAAREGMAFRGTTRARVVMHGTDTGARGVEVDLAEKGEVDAALVQLTPYETDSGLAPAGFHFAPGDRGTCAFRASQLWCEQPTVVAEGGGRAFFECANSLSSPVVVRSGTLVFTDFRLAKCDDSDWIERSAAAHVTAQRSGGYPIDESRLPTVPPTDVVLDMSSACPPDDRLAWGTGKLDVESWSLRTANGEARFAAKIVSKGHAYVYPLFWRGETTVGPNTRLVVTAKALNDFSAKPNRFSFDLMFADGTVARETGGPLLIGKTSTEGFTRFRIPLRRHCGKTIVSLMGRIDVRNAPGDYGMAFGEVRISNPTGNLVKKE